MFDLLVSSQNENSFPFVSLEQQKKKAKALGHGQRKEAFSYSPTDKENCRSAMTRVRSEKKTATRLTSKFESFFSLCFKG